ncbi:MAG: hypothetical protein KDA83_00385 [Planctomycetales bacterium]|nr:hypothetical protein [Planctomycetales bacterium]
MSRLTITDLVISSTPSLEDQDQQFGAGIRRRRLREFQSATAEVLESKQMLSATATAVFKNGVLTVNGTSRSEKIAVTENKGQLRVQVNGKSLRIAGAGSQVAATRVKQVAVNGKAGNDRIDVSSVNRVTRLDGGAGNDTILGGKKGDTIFGGSGNDRLYGRAGNDRIFGGSGNDLLEGGSGNDFLDGQSGKDRIKGGSGNDTLKGGTENDQLIGNEGSDRLYGESGDDVLIGGDSTDVLYGGAGNDEYMVGNDGDTSVIRDDQKVEANDGSIEKFISKPKVNVNSVNTRRPTLLVITQGAATTNVGGAGTGRHVYPWQETLAQAMEDDLRKAGSQVHTMVVSWNSLATNTTQTERVANHIKEFLAARSQQWDVVLVGHSRGAIFNQEIAGLLGDPKNMNVLQHVMIDPTAATSMGDQYPQGTPRNVDRAIVYDDGYQFLPFAAVRDGERVAGAEYQRVSLPDTGYYDTAASHNRIAKWYAQGAYHADLDWLLSQKSTGRYAGEQTSDNGREYVSVSGPAKEQNLIDVGFDPNRNGDMHGYISVLGVGGVDIKIGKSGVQAGGGVTFGGSAGVGLSQDGVSIHVTGPGAGPLNYGYGVVITKDEATVNADVGPLNITLSTKGGSIYVGGKRITFNKTVDKAGKWVVNQILASRERISTTLQNFERVRIEKFDQAGKLVAKGWKNGSQWVSQSLNSAGKVLLQWTYHGGYGSALKILSQYDAQGALLATQEFATNGVRLINKYINSSGQWVSQKFDSAGKMVSEWIYHGKLGSQLKQWRAWTSAGLSNWKEYATNGVMVAERFLDSAGKWISKSFDTAGKLLNQWSYFGGYGSALQQWKSWNAAGTFTGMREYLSNGVKTLDRWLNSSGNWISQKFNSTGRLVNEWMYHGGYGSVLKQYKAWSASGTFTNWSEYSTNGVKTATRWLDSRGRWISQRLNSAGKVLNQWLYFGGYGSKLQEWAEWSSGGKLLNLERFATNGLKTLDAYWSTAGNWVERTYQDGKEIAVKIWDSAGKYLGDQYKNFKDAASKLDPTTKNWWPF